MNSIHHGKALEAVIVEDEPESLSLLENLLSKTGLVEVTGSTTEPMNAVKLILELNPTIVFLDIRMPGMTGFDTRRSSQVEIGSSAYCFHNCL